MTQSTPRTPHPLRLLVAALAFTAASVVPAAPLVVSMTDAAGRPVENAVVAVQVAGVPAKAPPGATAEIGQRDRQFVPPVSVVQVGTAVSFPNFDTVRHHVYSFSAARPFELKLYVGSPVAPIVFDKPGLVAIGCNIHDRMQAWLAVVETPFHAVTDATGIARLDVPAGEHRLRAWRPADGDMATVVERPVRGGTGAPVAVRLPAGAT